MNGQNKRVGVQERLAAAQAAAELEPQAPRPRSMLNPVAEHARELRKSVEEENELLRAEVDRLRESGQTIKISAALIEPSKWCNRHPAAFADAKFKQLCEDIKRTLGNEQPILVRPKEGSEGRYEIAYGHRRHRACAEVGVDVNCIVKVLTDRQLIAAMHWENSDRSDLSKFEDGIFLRKQLDEKVYANNLELAAARGCSPSLISMLLAYAEIPSFVLDLFDDPRGLTKQHAQDIRAAQKKDGAGLRERAAAIRASGKPVRLKDRIAELLNDRKPTPIEIKTRDNKPLLRATKTTRGYQLEVFADLSRAQLKVLADQIDGFREK